ncbi:unnamed protein product [Calypogeia fissa]
MSSCLSFTGEVKSGSVTLSSSSRIAVVGVEVAFPHIFPPSRRREEPSRLGSRSSSYRVVDYTRCTGSGDVDTSTIATADDEGFIIGASGARLQINKAWKNPSREWRVGLKLVYELFTDTLASRVKKERKRKWTEAHREEIMDFGLARMLL